MKFSLSELLELGRLDGVDPVVAGDALPEIDGSDRTVAKRTEIFRAWSTRAGNSAAKRLRFPFLRAPVEVLGDVSIHGLVLRHMRDDPSNGPSDITTTLPVQAVIRSIGYCGAPRLPAATGLINRLLTDADRPRRAVSWRGWSGIDAAEISLGGARGRSRTRISDLDRRLEIAAEAG